jgi:hypothetical protein
MLGLLDPINGFGALFANETISSSETASTHIPLHSANVWISKTFTSVLVGYNTYHLFAYHFDLLITPEVLVISAYGPKKKLICQQVRGHKANH